jgi:hypothetical protein
LADKRPRKRTGIQPGYIELRVSSWEEFLKLITDSPYSNWAFRGQRVADWSLDTSLSRYLKNFNVNERAWTEQERRILRIFKRKAHQFLDKPPASDDDLQWLALMQHHGAPTRLLDFTWSPYVAAFFALERGLGDTAIWALNPKLNIAPSGTTKHRNTSRINPRMPGHFARYFLPNRIPFIWIGEPEVMNRRLVAQSGTFVLPGLLGQPMEEILRGYRHPEKVMAKFILPAGKVRETGMRELYRMNITYATLFPDLEGLARSMGYELEFHWAYDPRTMTRYSGFVPPS